MGCRTRHRRTAVDLIEVESENLISDLPTKERQFLGNTARKIEYVPASLQSLGPVT